MQVFVYKYWGINMEYIIKVNKLSKSYGERLILNNISFGVEKNSVFGLLGPSGAGKTTLINILIGQDIHYDGNVEVLENLHLKENKKKDSLSQQYGIVMDNPGLYERLSCYQNLKIFVLFYHIDKKRIDEVLDKVGLLDAKFKLVKQLSKGMTQRLVLARAMLNFPKILFLDEPTSGLDPFMAENIHKIILDLKDKGTTVFLTTHNMYEAQKICDNIVLLNNGKFIEQGKPKDICIRHFHEKKVEITHRNGIKEYCELNSKLADYIQKYGNDIVSIHSMEPNLNNIFIELTGRALDE